MPTGSGATPIPGLSGLVDSLIAEKFSQQPMYAPALLAAPLAGFNTRAGNYLIDATFKGLNLDNAPLALTAVPAHSTIYPDHVESYTSGSYSILRYAAGRFDVPDILAAEYSAQYGVDEAARVANALAEMCAGLHSRLVWSTLGDDANWATGSKSDLGNITSASADIIGWLDTVRTALLNNQAWAEGMDLDVFVAGDCFVHIQKLTQVLNKVNNPNANYATPDQVAGFFASYLPGCRVHRVDSRYKAQGGTITADFTGKMLFLPARPYPQRAVFTAVQRSASGTQLDPMSVRSERIEAMPGTRFYADLNCGVEIADNTGGYLGYSLLS